MPRFESAAKSLDSWKKKAAASEEKLACLQEDMDGLKRNRELTETRVIQALREELATVERRAEEERIAHNATKMVIRQRYVVGQYPRFLRAHWKFLKTMVNKLFQRLRFGIGSSNEKMEEQKRKSRAERFGIPSSSSADEDAKKKARLERFGQNTNVDKAEEEKRKARALRFAKTPSGSSEGNDKDNSKPDAATVAGTA